MKTTIDIPEKMLEEALKYTGAKTKKEAVLTAIEKYNKLRRLGGIERPYSRNVQGFYDAGGLENYARGCQVGGDEVKLVDTSSWVEYLVNWNRRQVSVWKAWCLMVKLPGAT